MAPTKNVAADANDGSEANMGIGSTREGTNTSLEVSIISGVSGVSVMPGLGGLRVNAGEQAGVTILRLQWHCAPYFHPAQHRFCHHSTTTHNSLQEQFGGTPTPSSSSSLNKATIRATLIFYNHKDKIMTNNSNNNGPTPDSHISHLSHQWIYIR